MRRTRRRLRIVELRDNPNEGLGEVMEIDRTGHVSVRRVPIPRPRLSQAQIDEIIAEMDRVAAQIGARWPAGVTALDAIDDVRS